MRVCGFVRARARGGLGGGQVESLYNGWGMGLMTMRRAMRLWGSVVLLFSLGVAAKAQGSGEAHEAGRLVLVLPFENRSGQANLQWIGESFPYTLDQRLNSSGFLTISRDDRQYAMDHLGFPQEFRPTRATTIRIAQTLDADYVVVGSFNVQAGTIHVQAQVLRVNQLSLSRPLEDSAELPRLFDVENAVAWKVAREIDPKFPVAQQTFLAAAGGVKLSAFENYIRGTQTVAPAERIKRLQAALVDEPTYIAALLALGKGAVCGPAVCRGRRDDGEGAEDGSGSA